ncbi:hypothetical protein [Streptomyces sp. NPDC101455]|uniref:hypothetical protein n=1 Tax=Streptomyces sp. NPDC101455 TaxID=3366142 RepID=UPI0038149473
MRRTVQLPVSNAGSEKAQCLHRRPQQPLGPLLVAGFAGHGEGAHEGRQVTDAQAVAYLVGAGGTK